MHVYTTFYLSIRPSVDTWVASTSWLLCLASFYTEVLNSNQGFKLVRKKEQNKNYAKILKILKIQPYLTKMSQNVHKWREHLGRLFTSLKKLKKNKMLDFLNLTDLPTTKSKCVLKESKIRQLSLYNT